MNDAVPNSVQRGWQIQHLQNHHKQRIPRIVSRSTKVQMIQDSLSGRIRCLKTVIPSNPFLILLILLSSNVNQAAAFTPLSSRIRKPIQYSSRLPPDPTTTTPLFPRGIITSQTKLPSLLTASTEQENETADDEESVPPPATPEEMIQKFNSYATNISRTRNIMDGITVKRNSGDSHSEHHHERKLQLSSQPSPASMSAIRSLVYTLKSEAEALHTSSCCDEPILLSMDMALEMQETINHALIQAIRAASDHGDYVMIRTIVEAAIAYTKAVSQVYRIQIVDRDNNGGGDDDDDDDGKRRDYDQGLLRARVFGEAISGMSRTKASHSKLKKLWTVFIDLNSANSEGDSSGSTLKDTFTILSKPENAFELNSMITGLGDRGKFRTALKLYEEVIEGKDDEDESSSSSSKLKVDQYTASALFTMLSNSIALDDSPDNNGKNSHPLQSPCWQWNEAVSILNTFDKKMELNNQIYASILKVNEQAMELYRSPGNRHPGAKCAMTILKRMQKRNISPDVITCSVVMSAFDKGKQWKAALALLDSMETSGDNNGSQMQTDSNVWKLPKPNVYTYSSAISSCARSGQYEEAIKVLDRFREISNSDIGSVREDSNPNTWLYNAALAACVPLPKDIGKQSSQSRFKTAISIFHRMEEDSQKGLHTSPDRVSYNTLISSVGGIDGNEDIASISSELFDFTGVENPVESKYENVVLKILEKMNADGIPKDPGTYRNAITACKANPISTIRLLDKALADPDLLKASRSEWDSLEAVRLYLINEVLSVCAAKGEMEFVSKIFMYINEHGLKANSKTMLSLLKGISLSGNCEDSMVILNAMKGDGAANEQLKEKYDIDIIQSGIDSSSPMVEEQHYAAGITGCLRDGQLFPALKILSAMKLHGLKPDTNSLQGIILAYCKLATDEASVEFKASRREYSKGQIKGPAFQAEHSSSRSRASAALAMMNTMNTPPVKLQCVVASACAASGMWNEARKILWDIHVLAFYEKKRETSVEVVNLDQGSAIEELPRLHRSLLKLCARSGNVTAALWYVDAIQDLQSKFDRRSFHTPRTQDSNMFSGEIDAFGSWNSTVTSSSLKYGIGMTGEDWKLLMIAASKSAHWRVCIGTLPFIQPYVEATHPRNASNERGKSPSIKNLNKQYNSLSRALTASVLAFEVRSQYAWAIRAIDDWIAWSGRRPAKEAVFSACRILAARGVGDEVVQLVSKVIEIPNHSTKRRTKKKFYTYESSYETAVFIEAMTALYKRGLYDSADELYMNAITGGFLQFSTTGETSESLYKIDLHGMNRVIAHSAVRVSLQHLIQTKPTDTSHRDILIVTGKGKRSARHLRPVLRPEIQRMLVEEFYPPISTSSIPNNLGALRISADDANAWITHQQQQKGVRFLAVADVLKTITTGSRLKRALKQKLEKETIDPTTE